MGNITTRAALDPRTYLAKSGAGKTLKAYKQNEPVFLQGDPSDAVYYVRKGKLKLTVLSNAGREAVIALLGSGDFLGEECLAGKPVRLSSAVALSDCSILRIEKTVMMNMLHTEPAFSELFVSYLLTRTMRIEADLVDQLFNSSERRLARVLLLLANFGQAGKPAPVIAKISQETLANMIGTTRSRVSFFMNKFRKLGLINYTKAGDGKIEVHSSLLNIVLHD